MEAPHEVVVDLLWNVGVGAFVLTAVLCLGQVASLVSYIGGALSSTLCPPPPARNWRRSIVEMAAAEDSLAASPASGADGPEHGKPKHRTPTLSLSPAPERMAAAAGPTGAGTTAHKAKHSSSSSRRDHTQDDEEIVEYFREQEAKFDKKLKEKSVKLIGVLLDDIFERECGSRVVNSMPPGLKHQCFVTEFLKRVAETEAKALLAAANNPMAIKRAAENTLDALLPQSQKGLTPRRARKATDALALALETSPPTGAGSSYPHVPRNKPVEVRERLFYFLYYQALHKQDGKFWGMVVATIDSPDGIITETIPGTACTCCNVTAHARAMRAGPTGGGGSGGGDHQKHGGSSSRSTSPAFLAPGAAIPSTGSPSAFVRPPANPVRDVKFKI